MQSAHAVLFRQFCVRTLVHLEPQTNLLSSVFLFISFMTLLFEVNDCVTPQLGIWQNIKSFLQTRTFTVYLLLSMT